LGRNLLKDNFIKRAEGGGQKAEGKIFSHNRLNYRSKKAEGGGRRAEGGRASNLQPTAFSLQPKMGRRQRADGGRASNIQPAAFRLNFIPVFYQISQHS
jgi:hypothetical protein